MKARLALPLGMVAAMVSGAALSGVTPTRMLGVSDVQARHAGDYEPDMLYHSAAFSNDFPVDPGFGLSPDPDRFAHEPDDAGLYDDDLAATELDRTYRNPGYAVMPDDLPPQYQPLPPMPASDDFPESTSLASAASAPIQPSGLAVEASTEAAPALKAPLVQSIY